MDKYVVRKGVHCQVVEHGWKVKSWKSDVTGQREVMAWKKRLYLPLGDIDDPEVWDKLSADRTTSDQISERLSGVRAVEVDDGPPTEEDKQRELERKERSLKKSAERGKRNCRYRIKAAAMASLLTCTYRENMTDFNRVRADWATFLRKLERLMPGFRAIYAFERQDRGAWHVHAAIDKLPTHFMVRDLVSGRGRSAVYRDVKVRSWDFLRRLWQSVVGKDNGNIDVDGHRKTRHGVPGKFRKEESLARLAGYVSKYLTKDHAIGIEGRNRWGSTQGIDVEKPVCFDLPESSIYEVFRKVYELPEGHRIAQHRMGQFGKFWVLYSEPDPAQGGDHE